MIFGSKHYLLDALEIARILMLIYAVLSGYRLTNACDKSKFILSFERHSRHAWKLQEFMTACRQSHKQ